MGEEQSFFGMRELEKVINTRRTSGEPGSYTRLLFGKGAGYVCRKLQEEAFEVIWEACKGDRELLVKELADLFYHALVLAACYGIALADIEKVLATRHESDAVERTLDRLKAYELKDSPATFDAMCAETGLEIGGATDVVLFPPSLAWRGPLRKGAQGLFPPLAKSLCMHLQSNKLKVKMGVASGEPVTEGGARRAGDVVLPLIYIANMVAVPFCVNLLAGYLKDWMERAAGDRKTGIKKRKTSVLICVSFGQGQTERWFRLEGGVQKVQEDLSSAAGRG